MYNQAQGRNFRSQHQSGSKPTRWEATFQAHDINGKGLLEALKKLAAYNTIKNNGPENNLFKTNYEV